MFIISAIQTISFILIGNYILEIKGMIIPYWIVLFTTSCLANMIGLNISSAFNSVITIYILIPFILIPQLLFSGVIVKFDKLHLTVSSSREFVPVIGDLMAARWSFEALAVKQFRDNNFERQYFKSHVKESQNSYYAMLTDKLNENLWLCNKYGDSINYKDLVNENFKRLNWHIDELAKLSNIAPGQWKSALNLEMFKAEVNRETKTYLDSLKKHFNNLYTRASKSEDSLTKSLDKTLGEEGRIGLQNNYENKRLKFVVLDLDNIHKTYETTDKIIQKYEPGYMKATSKYGRAHFYAPSKMIGNIEIDTFWFNLLVLWLVTLVLYLALYYNILQRMVTYLGKTRLEKSAEI